MSTHLTFNGLIEAFRVAWVAYAANDGSDAWRDELLRKGAEDAEQALRNALRKAGIPLDQVAP